MTSNHTTEPSERERVAKALFEHEWARHDNALLKWDEDEDGCRDYWLGCADAVLAVLSPSPDDRMGEVGADYDSANSHLFEDRIIVDGVCIAFSGGEWTSKIVRALASPASMPEITDTLARKVLFDFRRRDGLTCYAHADNEAKHVRYMKEALSAALGSVQDKEK